MKAFLAFTKKELGEGLRTYRAIILAAVFVLLGIMSPLFAKLLPALLDGADLGNGLTVTMPDPVAMDSWTQFFKNVGQIGMLTLAIVFSGIMANELSRGTLVNLLTKGMRRHTVILAKFLAASVLWAGCYLLCLAVCWAYTAYYWPNTVLDQAFMAFFAPWLFGELLIALLVLGGTVFGSLYGSLLSCGGAVVVLNLVDIAPKAARYNPIVLAGGTLGLLTGQQAPADFIWATVICAALTIAAVAASVIVFNKRRL